MDDVTAAPQKLDLLTRDKARTFAEETSQVDHLPVQNSGVIMEGEKSTSDCLNLVVVEEPIILEIDAPAKSVQHAPSASCWQR